MSASSYTATRVFFCLSWSSFVVTAYVFFVILTRPARRVWTAIVATVLGCALFWFYVRLCPTFVVEPKNLSIYSSDDLYIIRLSKTDSDLYANSFLFRLEPDLYSASDLELSVAQRFLRPLERQPARSTEKLADILGVSGEDQDGNPILVVYVYHLPPRDSRELGLKFNGYLLPNRPVVISEHIMSYSERPLPISKIGDIVTIPLGIKQHLTLRRQFYCFLNVADSEPCRFDSFVQLGQLNEPGCYYIASVKGRRLPDNIQHSGGSCEIGDFKTWNFKIW